MPSTSCQVCHKPPPVSRQSGNSAAGIDFVQRALSAAPDALPAHLRHNGKRIRVVTNTVTGSTDEVFFGAIPAGALLDVVVCVRFDEGAPRWSAAFGPADLERLGCTSINANGDRDIRGRGLLAVTSPDVVAGQVAAAR